MEKQSFFQEMAQRAGSETPDFFVKIRNIGIVLGAIGSSLAPIPGIPILIPAILIAVGTSFCGVASLAKKDINQL